jgi:recombination associated protein RdgC
MFFKALTLYRLERDWLDQLPPLDELLAQHPLREIPPSAIECRGWHPLVRSSAGADQITMLRDYRSLPGAAVRLQVSKRVAELQARQGYAVGRRQRQEIQEAVIARMTPTVPVQRAELHGVIDREAGLLLVNTTTPARADDFTRTLRDALGSLPATPLIPELPMTSLMTRWLANGKAPGAFSIDDECQLVARDERRASVRYVHHNLEGGDVVGHLKNGKLATRLALMWRDRIAYVIDEHMALRKLRFLDEMQIAENRSDCDHEQAELADLTLMVGMLREMLAELIDVTGVTR